MLDHNWGGLPTSIKAERTILVRLPTQVILKLTIIGMFFAKKEHGKICFVNVSCCTGKMILFSR